MSLVLLIGGARAGKSTLALELARKWAGGVVFIATAEARDDEMTARIAAHRAQRPEEWKTIEEPVELVTALEALADDEHAIVDCLTIWVANLLERGRSEDEILVEAERIAELAASRQAPVTVVTNEVGLGVVPATPLGRAYRDLLGAVNRACAERASDVYLVVAGRALALAAAEDLP
jgi:adenosyl cobinamide kinase/adenosyl cobinamide phosphate guanylyltransferase